MSCFRKAAETFRITTTACMGPGLRRDDAEGICTKTQFAFFFGFAFCFGFDFGFGSSITTGKKTS